MEYSTEFVLVTDHKFVFNEARQSKQRTENVRKVNQFQHLGWKLIPFCTHSAQISVVTKKVFKIEKKSVEKSTLGQRLIE